MAFKSIVTFALCIVFSAQLLARESISLCGSPNYPPFNWVSKGRVIGVGPSLAKMIFSELGIDVKNHFQGNWARCLKDIETGKAQLFTSGYRTVEREKFTVYSNTPMYSDSQVVFVWKDRKFKFENWSDLKRRRAGILHGVSLGDKFDKFMKENLYVERVSTRRQNFQKMELDRIDFDIIGHLPGIIQVKKLGYEGKIITLKTPITTENLYFGISKKSLFQKHIPYIEKRLKEFHKDGTIKQLVEQHLKIYSGIDSSGIL